MKSALVKAVYLLLGVGAAVFLVAAIVGRSSPPVRQPLPFNHAKHVKAGWKCANCHPYVDQQAFAGIPHVKDCVDCHETDMPKHPDNVKMRQITKWLRTQATEGREIPWVPVHQTAPFIYFSHRRHVEVAKLDCKACHGDVASMTQPFTLAAFPTRNTRKMLWCLGCHKQKRASTDCLSCHR